MKRLAFLSVLVLAGVALAQPAPPAPVKPAPLTPQPKIARVEAEVLLIGCGPLHVVCGYLMVRQEMALRVTKADIGPFKVGDTPVVDVVTCFDGPLLRKTNSKEPFVELDPMQIRRGSRISLEFEVYPSGNLATTDKIAVTTL